MPDPDASPRRVRFHGFELDLRSGELRKYGVKIALQGQPFEILALLAERPGELVTREELRSKLWPADTFVDFEDGLNTAVRKIRAALGDSPEKPQFVETLPRRGYRFVAPVEPVGAGPVEPENGRASAAVFVTSSNGSAPVSSMAVLPLQNLSGDPDQEYFADGMTEALTTNLAQIRQLRVISRTSAMQYKHARKTMPEIARELSVERAVEGSVSRSQAHVRVTIQLIHAPTDRHLWAKTYERELQDVLRLQSDLALAIAAELQIHLTPAEKERLSRPQIAKPEAVEAYLKGRYFWNRRSEAAMNRAIDYFNCAIQEDPAYAHAYAGLADCYAILAWNSMRPPQEALPKAKAAATTALRIDDQLAEAHSSLAFSLMFLDWNWEKAEREFKRSIELNPSYGVVRPWYAFELAAMGREVEACAEAQRAVRIDPLSLPIAVSAAMVSYLARRYDQAIELSLKLLEMEPATFYLGYFVLGLAYERKNMFAEAVAAEESAASISGRNAHMIACLGYVLGRSGRDRDAYKVIDELKARSAQGYIAPFNVAMVYAGLGVKEQTLEWLERAFDDRSMWSVFLNAYPIFDDLRPDPRFQDLVRRMGFPL